MMITSSTIPPPLFKPYFHPQFGCRDNVFEHIYWCVKVYDVYFKLKKDAVENIECSSYQKCTAPMGMFAYGTMTNSWDKYLRMSENTCLEAYEYYLSSLSDLRQDDL